MAVLVRCPKCAGQMSAPDTAAGKKVRCPRCAEIVPVPSEAAPPPPSPPAALAVALKSVPPPRVSAVQTTPPFVLEFADDDAEDAPRPRRRRSVAETDVRRMIPTDPEDILSPSEYRNYRNVRAVSKLYVVLGSLIALAGLAALTDKENPAPDKAPPAFGALLLVVGLCGAFGGIATLRRSKRWAPLVYVMGVLYILAFPLGTILSYVLLSGLSKYLAVLK